MAVITELHLGPPPALAQAISALANFDDRITRIMRDITFYENAASQSEGVPEAGVAIIDALYAQEGDTAFQRAREILLPLMRQQIYDYTALCGRQRHSATTLRNNLTEIQANRTRAQMTVDSLQHMTDCVLELSAVKRALSPYAISHIKFTQTGGDPGIEMVFKNLVLTPMFMGDTQPNWLKNADGGPFKLKIPPVRVTINLRNNVIKFKCIRAYKDQYITGMNRYTVAHPHVLGRYDPCLGDWGMPLMEALGQRDIAMVAELLLNVLQSAYDADGAGVHWRKYLHRNLQSAPFEYFHAYNLDLSPDPLYHFWLCDRNGNVQLLVNTEPTWPEIKIQRITTAPEAPITEETELEELPELEAGPSHDSDDRDGYDADGYDREGYDEDGYDEHGYNRDGYDSEGYNYDGYDRNGYDREGYDADGWDRDGFNSDGYDGLGFDRYGWNRDGYNEEGYDRDGYNKDGYNENGRDVEGYDTDGYNEAGYNIFGLDRNGFDRDGYNEDGRDAEGYDRDDLDKEGHSRFDDEGFDRNGYNIVGLDRDGFDKDGFDRNGFNRDGFDDEGYDGLGFDRYGWNRDGYGYDGFNRDGFDRDGYPRNGYNRNGFDKDGYDRLGYHRDAYTVNKFNESRKEEVA